MKYLNKVASLVMFKNAVSCSILCHWGTKTKVKVLRDSYQS